MTPTEQIFLYVDDLILCTEPKNARTFVKCVRKKLNIHDLGFPTDALEIQIRREKSGICLPTNKS